MSFNDDVQLDTSQVEAGGRGGGGGGGMMLGGGLGGGGLLIVVVLSLLGVINPSQLLAAATARPAPDRTPRSRAAAAPVRTPTGTCAAGWSAR